MKPLEHALDRLLAAHSMDVATVHDVDADGAVTITRGRAATPVRARIGCGARLQAGDEVVVLLEGGDAERPVIVSPVHDSVPAADTPPTRTLRAREELVLECGEASISLQADGRIVIRGGYVETYAEGTNRIKGAQVRIN